MRSELQLDPVLRPICPAMWSVTPYERCDLRCIYCCTLAQGDSEPSKHSVDRIWKGIKKIPVDDTLIFGAFSDAYPRAESEHRLTRELLRRLVDSERLVYIVTKGVGVLDDLDVLRQLGRRVLVQMSISTMDDEKSLQIEPGAAATSERLQVLWQLYEAGVPVEVNALPWIPGVSDIGRLVAAIPTDVTVTVSPLATRLERSDRRLMRQRFEREDIVRLYLEEKERIGPNPQLSWIKPAPQGHHHPMHRFEKYRPANKAIEPEVVRVLV